MKKIFPALILTLLITGCSSQTNDIDSSTIDSKIVEVVSLSSNKDIKNKLSDEQINSLDTSKNGFGQGVQLDEENRPLGSLDFNEKYEKYDSIAITNEKKTIYLTFDQGYENGYTSVILDTLKEKNVKATFFVIGDYVKRNEKLIQRMIDEGHVIGNHSDKHYSMPALSIDEAKGEVLNLHKYMQDKFNYNMTVFRPAMGEYSEKSLAITQACGYKTVLWSYAYADWDTNKQPDPKVAYNKLTGAAHDGAVYLLHSVSKTNTAVLPMLIDELISKGYTFKCF